jgi:hypothetical protein
VAWRENDQPLLVKLDPVAATAVATAKAPARGGA